MDQNRIPLWDNLRCFLILTVVIGHFTRTYTSSAVLESVTIFIYSFHMPLFLFVTGLFHKNTRIPQKMLAYFLIYLLLKAAIFFVKLAFHRGPTFHVFTEDGVPWFMYSLAVYIGLTYLLRNVDRRLVLAAALLFACISGYDSSIEDKYVLSRTIVFYPFYYLGVITPRDKLGAVLSKKAVQIPAAVVVLLWAGLCVFCLSKVSILHHLFQGKYPFDEALHPYGLLYRVLCMIISTAVGLSFMALTPKRTLPVITRTGQRTLQIFFWHRPIQYALSYLGVLGILRQTPGGPLLWPLLAVVLTFFLALRPFMLPTKWIMDTAQTSSSDNKLS